MATHRLRLLRFSKSQTDLKSNTNFLCRPPKSIRSSTETRTSIDINVADTGKIKIRKKEKSKSNKKRDKSPANVSKKFKKTNKFSEPSPACEYVIPIKRESSPFKSNLPHKKSKSDTVRFSPKYKLKKRTRKSISLIDVKRVFSSRCQYYHNIKRAVRALRKDLSSARGPNRIKKKNKKVQVIYVNNPRKVRDTSNRLKSSLKCRKLKKNRENASTSITDIFGSSNDSSVFGFRKRNRLRFPYTSMYERRRHDNNYFFHLLNRKSTKKKSDSDSTKLNQCPQRTIHKVISSGPSTESHNRFHYDLVNFPKRRFMEPNRSRSNNRLQKPKSRDIYKARCNMPYHGRKVDASVSCLKLKCPSAGVETSNVIFKSSPACKKSVSFRKSCDSTCPSKERKQQGGLKHDIVSRIVRLLARIYSKRYLNGGFIIKYLIIGLVGVIWFPCILAVGCAWLLTYPLRPQHLIVGKHDVKNMKKNTQPSCTTNTYFTNPWTYMVSNMKKYAQRCAFKSVLRFDKHGSNSDIKPHKTTCNQNKGVPSMSTKSAVKSKSSSKSINNINKQNPCKHKVIIGTGYQCRSSPVICERVKPKSSWKQFFHRASDFLLHGNLNPVVNRYGGGSHVTTNIIPVRCSLCRRDIECRLPRPPCLIREPCISKQWSSCLIRDPCQGLPRQTSVIMNRTKQAPARIRNSSSIPSLIKRTESPKAMPRSKKPIKSGLFHSLERRSTPSVGKRRSPEETESDEEEQRRMKIAEKPIENRRGEGDQRPPRSIVKRRKTEGHFKLEDSRKKQRNLIKFKKKKREKTSNVKVSKEEKKGTSNKKKAKDKGCDDDDDNKIKSFKDFDRVLAKALLPQGASCRDLYLLTWKTRPHFWFFGCSPKMYPWFVSMHRFFMSCFHGCMVCLSITLWCPVFLVGYLCLRSCKDMLCCGC